MNKPHIPALVVFSLLNVLGQLTMGDAARAQTPSQDYAIFERGANHRVWQKTQLVTNAVTGQVSSEIHQFTELANGLHYYDGLSGQWETAQDLVELAPTGEVVARQAQHMLILNPNINTAGAVDLLTPDQKRLRIHVLGIYLTDRMSGQSVQIATVKDSLGEVIVPNRVIYRSCFDGIRASLVYTFTKGAFEQDVYLEELPALPPTFRPETTLIVVVTEFIDPPVPVKRQVILKKEEDPVQRALMTMPDLINEDLNFGVMQMLLGRAFAVEGSVPVENQRRIPVAKRWQVSSGRTFLTEAVEYQAIAQLFQATPQARLTKREHREFARLEQLLPERPRSSAKMESARYASTGCPERGVVIDYVIVISQPDYIFASGNTYLVNGMVTISSSTSFRSTAVIKYENNSWLTLDGEVDCPTSDVAFLTARDDNTIGESIPGAAQPLTVAIPALELYNVQCQ